MPDLSRPGPNASFYNTAANPTFFSSLFIISFLLSQVPHTKSKQIFVSPTLDLFLFIILKYYLKLSDLFFSLFLFPEDRDFVNLVDIRSPESRTVPGT